MTDPIATCEKIQMVLLKCVDDIRLLLDNYREGADMMSISQAATLLKRHPQTLRRLEKDGKLVPQRRGGSKYRYYTRKQLVEFLESEKTAATSGNPANEPNNHKDEEEF